MSMWHVGNVRHTSKLLTDALSRIIVLILDASLEAVMSPIANTTASSLLAA